MIKQVIVMLVLLSAACCAEDLYVAQSSAGDDSGSSCANAKSAVWFNTAGSWGAGAAKISAGDTAHLCGTITSALEVGGSGSSGSPITVKFETGAILTSATWGGGYALGSASDRAYIIIDGGTNGIIRTTGNGTSLANQNDDQGVSFGAGCDNCEFKNLTIGPMYVRVRGADQAGQGSSSISVWDASNLSIHNNTCFDGKWLISFGYRPGNSGIDIYSNTLYNTDHGVTVASLGSGSAVSSVAIYGNTIYDFVNWDDTSVNNSNHHDGIHAWADGSAGTNLSITGLDIYNNYIYGNFGSTATAGIYVEETNGNAVISTVRVFNNVIANSVDNAPCCGLIYLKGEDASGMPGAQVYNNTMVEGSDGSMSVQLQGSGLTNVLYKNNIIWKGALALGLNGPSSIASGGSDYNVFYPNSLQFIYNGGWIGFTDWKTNASGIDSHSTETDPKLNSNFTLQAGSSAIGLGVNLTGLGITALNSDKAGVGRPSSGAWDAGALQYGAASPEAPTITSTSPLAGGTMGTAYSQQLTATGDATITWAVTDGDLPDGLSLSSSGLLSGTPTIAETQVFEVTATNDTGSDVVEFSLTISAGPAGHSRTIQGRVTVRRKVR